MWFMLVLLVTFASVYVLSIKDLDIFRLGYMLSFTLLEKCPYPAFFWSVFSRFRTEYREMWTISSYSVRMRENTEKENSKYGQFSPSVSIVKDPVFIKPFLANVPILCPVFSEDIKWKHWPQMVNQIYNTTIRTSLEVFIFLHIS